MSMSTAASFSYDREPLARWAAERIDGAKWGEWYQAIGYVLDGQIAAVVVFNNYSECDIGMHVAADPQSRWLTREFLERVFAYPFGQLGVKRITSHVAASKQRELNFFKGLGFHQDGYLKDALPNDDAVIVGILKDECRFYGKESEQPASGA